MQLSANWRVSISCQHRRGKVSVAVSRDDQSKVHETADPDFDVFEDVSDVFGSDFAFDGAAALVHAQAGSDVFFLVLLEPFDLFGEVGK